MILIRNYNLTINEIDNLPVTKYFMMINEYFNQGSFEAGGEFKFSNPEESMQYKKMQAYRKIQDLKRQGRWQ